MKNVPARIPNQTRQVLILLKQQRMVVTDVKNEKVKLGLTSSILNESLKSRAKSEKQVNIIN